MLGGTIDRIWTRLENRYAADDGCGCGCDSEAPPEARAVLENSNLSEEELVSYFKGELPFDELVSRVDADLEGETINDLDSLAKALGGQSDESAPRTATSD